ncbi:MAG: methyl-accepting chemotaxis protein [Pseudobutyrivibrio sp.]|nr:methyl-accepting chemotaxis protein [Pseudobutyrivibrio sp.]
MVRKRKLAGHIMRIALAVSCLIVAALVSISAYYLINAYESTIEDQLRTSAVQLDDMINHTCDGDWKLSENGELMKGDMVVHDQCLERLGDLSNKTGLKYTVFYGNTRYISTMTNADGSSMEGTTASDAVYQSVVKEGNDYYMKRLKIGDSNYNAYYVPLCNTDGSRVGMLFAGKETNIIYKTMNSALLQMFLVAGIGLTFLFIVGIKMMRSSSSAMHDIVEGLRALSRGELTYWFAESSIQRKDEVGIIAEAATELRDKLTEVITNTISLSEQVSDAGDELARSAEGASAASSQVTSAVDDISKGAVSQAESVGHSVGNTTEIGTNIISITESVEELSSDAKEMNSATDRTISAVTELLKQNEAVIISMNEIRNQIRATNEAVIQIAEASKSISSISNQTNLLALNASIEAARAGEQGKGFAVVATEISTLADQSGEAAVSINEIVSNLVKESQESVNIIEKLNTAFQEQIVKLNSTKEDMDGMVVNVASVKDSASLIQEKVGLLNSSKDSLNNIIEDLSAISQQNAASSEETNASMEELNATFEIINHSADELKELALNLNEEINFFKLEVAG